MGRLITMGVGAVAGAEGDEIPLACLPGPATLMAISDTSFFEVLAGVFFLVTLSLRRRNHLRGLRLLSAMDVEWSIASLSVYARRCCHFERRLIYSLQNIALVEQLFSV